MCIIYERMEKGIKRKRECNQTTRETGKENLTERVREGERGGRGVGR